MEVIMTYTMSVKRKIQDLKQFNFDQALEVLRLRNQGWTFQAIGNKLNLTRQRVAQLYEHLGKMTVEEAELYQRVLSKLDIDNTNK